MDAFFDQFALQRLTDLAMNQVLDWGLISFYTFLLVLIRMSGLMSVGPIFGQSIVPANMRILLVLTMTFLMTPTLYSQSKMTFSLLDANQDHRVTRDEVPKHLLSRYDALVARTGRSGSNGLTASEFDLTPEVPSTLIGFALAGIAEFSLGFLLGLGVQTILSGLQLAGHLIDQQTGLALGEVFSPGLEIEGSLSGQFLYFLGIAVLLVMEPINGHLQILSVLMDTFQTIPVGQAMVPADAGELLRNLVQESFILAVRVAAPILATMSLVALCMGFLGHTVPQINILLVGFPVRVLVSLLLLGTMMGGATELITRVIPDVLHSIGQTIGHVS